MRTGTRINHYDVLGVSPGATADAIKTAYRARVNYYHPDRNRSSEAHYVTVLINQAWEVLGDTERRESYDATMGFNGSKESQEDTETRERASRDSAGASETSPPTDPPPPPPKNPETRRRPDSSTNDNTCPGCGTLNAWATRHDGSEGCWRCGKPSCENGQAVFPLAITERFAYVAAAIVIIAVHAFALVYLATRTTPDTLQRNVATPATESTDEMNGRGQSSNTVPSPELPESAATPGTTDLLPSQPRLNEKGRQTQSIESEHGPQFAVPSDPAREPSQSMSRELNAKCAADARGFLKPVVNEQENLWTHYSATYHLCQLLRVRSHGVDNTIVELWDVRDGLLIANGTIWDLGTVTGFGNGISRCQFETAGESTANCARLKQFIDDHMTQ